MVVYYLASASGKQKKALCGVLGFCGWFPFERQVEEFFSSFEGDASSSDG